MLPLGFATQPDDETQHIQAIKLYEKGYLREKPTRRYPPQKPTQAFALKRIFLRKQNTGNLYINPFSYTNKLSSPECEAHQLLLPFCPTAQ